jgi:hypothetical protein
MHCIRLLNYFDFSCEDYFDSNVKMPYNVFWGWLDAAPTNGFYKESPWSIIAFETFALRLISSEIPKAKPITLHTPDNYSEVHSEC